VDKLSTSGQPSRYYVDYGDHYTADWGYVWLQGQESVYAVIGCILGWMPSPICMYVACGAIYLTYLSFWHCCDAVAVMQMCLLESETKDVELRRECITTLGFVSQAQLSSKVIPTFISTLKEVCVRVVAVHWAFTTHVLMHFSKRNIFNFHTVINWITILGTIYYACGERMLCQKGSLEWR